jgi:hypothetical protein
VSRRFVLSLAAGVLVALATATAIYLSSGEDAAPRADDSDPPAANLASPPEQVLVVRRRGGVPLSWTRRFRRTPGVTAIASTARTQALMQRSRRASGRTVEAVRPGYAIPLDALVIRPRAFARVVAAVHQFDRLRHGTALLSRTSARLRGLESGDRITLAGGRQLLIAGIVDDERVRFAELVLTRADTGGGRKATRQLLIATTDPKRVARVFSRREAVRVGVLSANQRPSAGLVTRPLETKARFGEFAVGLPYGSDWIRIDPRWVGRNIVTRSVPLLGSVTCNRRIFKPLHRALRSLERRGLSRVVDRSGYAGCFAPRRIPGSGSLSLHAWGLAIDINASANPRLGKSRQDRRLVQAMEDAGFTWGGRWPTVPDPMHFELHS